MTNPAPFQLRFVLVTATDEPITREFAFSNARERDAYLMGVKDGLGTKYLTKVEIVNHERACFTCGAIARVCKEGVWVCPQHDGPVAVAIAKEVKKEKRGD